MGTLDDGLFALIACHLEVGFDRIVTAEQVALAKEMKFQVSPSPRAVLCCLVSRMWE